MPTYRLDILITGTDRASPQVQRFGGVLSRIGQIATGILIAGAIRGITDQIWDLGRTAVESYTELERMQVGLESLIARELARGDVITTTATSIQHITEEEILALDKLKVKYADLQVEMEDLVEEQQAAIDEFGEGSIEALRYSVAIRELQNEINATTGEMAELEAIEGKVITSLITSKVETVSLAEALKLARGPAKQLTDWIVRLSLITPFEENDVVMALRVAAGYGFITQYAADAATEEERLQRARDDGVVTAQRLTASLLDLMAAIGLPSENLQRIVLALGQVRAHGKLLAQEIRQLINAGVGLDIMALAMDMTVDEFMAAQKAGNILAEDFLPALVDLLEKDLAGAAERVQQTLGGVINAFGKLRRVQLRTFFGPTFEAITPALLELVERLSSPESLERTERWGISLRDNLQAAWDWASRLYGAIQRTQNFFDNPWEIVLATVPEDWDVQTKRKIVETIQSIGDIPIPDLGFEQPEEALGGAVQGVTAALSITGLIGGLGTILGLLGKIGGWLGPIGIGAGILGALWKGNFLGIQEVTKTAWEKYLKPAFEGIYKWVTTELPPKIEELTTKIREGLWQAWIEFQGWVDETLIPALRDIRDWLAPKIAEAMGKVVLWLHVFLIPAMRTLWTVLKEDLLPRLQEFYRTLGEKIVEGFKKFQWWANEVKENAMPTLKFAFEDVMPVLYDFARFLKETAITAMGKAHDTIHQTLDPALRSIWSELTIWVLPVLTTFIAKLNSIRTHAAERVKEAFDDFILPGLISLWGWLSLNVIPVVKEFVGLLSDIQDLASRIFGGIFVNFVLPKLEELWLRLKDDVNVVLGIFYSILTKIDEILGTTLQERFGNVIDNILPTLQRWADWAASALENLRNALHGLRSDLRDWKPPWFVLGNSPPPMATWFYQIADSVRDVSKAIDQSPLSRWSAGIQSPMLQPALAQPGVGQVIVEGDTNTFIVEDEGVARLVAHQLREQKLKRFSEYMGR